MIKQIAALALAASLGAGSTAAVLSASQGAKPVYVSHGVDIRVTGAARDGGAAISVMTYASRGLPDGGRKDVGRHVCPTSAALDTAGASLLAATVACVREDP